MSSTSTSLMATPARASIGSAVSTVSRALPTPMQTAPSTPAAQTTIAKPSPGTFRHPRLTEIIQRQNKTLLTQSNVRSAAINTGALVLSFAFRGPLQTIITTFLTFFSIHPSTAASTATTLLIASCCLFSINIIISLRQRIPYLAKSDTLDDIPLTPSQRALLGLPASPANNTPTRTGSPLATAPSTGFITPPRYHRRLSSNSNSPSSPNRNVTSDARSSSTDRRSISANYSASPLSTSRHTLGFSPSPNAPQTAQPYNRPTSRDSPQGSPLFHRAIERTHGGRRQSHGGAGGGGGADFRESVGGTAGGLGRSHSVRGGDNERGGNPNPSVARAARKGVNFKWLYDREYALVGPGANGNGAGNGVGVNGGGSIGPGGGNGNGNGNGGRGLASSRSMQF